MHHRKNNEYGQRIANVDNDGAREMESGLFDGRYDGEHKTIALAWYRALFERVEQAHLDRI